jgi:uncharacterized phage-associated protein
MSIEIEKIRNIAIYLSERMPNLYFTKFLKLIYYMDFIAVQETGSPVTNDTYFALPYGPVPSFVKDNINLLDESNRESETNLLKTSEDGSPSEDRGIFEGYITLKKEGGTIIEKLKDYDDTKLSGYEKKLLDDIIITFKDVSAKDIVEKTHRETPYTQTALNNVIDYGMAFQLNIKEILPMRDFTFDKEISLSRFNAC